MDIIELAGLIFGIVAVIIAVIGIRDVRKQVRFLLNVERGRAYTKALNEIVLNFVDPVDDKTMRWANMHEFCMLQKALDQKRTVDTSQKMVNNEAVQTAAKLVSAGYASWKPQMDEEKAARVVKEWQDTKNAATLNSIFGDRWTSLF